MGTIKKSGSRIIVAVLGNDFRLAFLIQSKLPEHGDYKITHVTDPTDLPKQPDVIVTPASCTEIGMKTNSAKRLVHIRMDAIGFSAIHLHAEIARALREKDKFSEVVIGIDPGETTGLSCIADSELMASKVFSSLGVLLAAISDLLMFFPGHVQIVRVGNGGGFRSNVLLNALLHQFKNRCVIELVDEHSTSIATTRRHSDVIAAHAIARRVGEVVSSSVQVKIVEQEIKTLKRSARSKGKSLTDADVADLVKGRRSWLEVL